MEEYLNLCSYCNKAFPSISKLKIHERVHTNSEPFVCNVCGKRFSQSSNLNKHKLTHLPKQFSCALCEQKFSAREHAEKHIRNQHNILSGVDEHIWKSGTDLTPLLEVLPIEITEDNAGERVCNCPMCRVYCLCALSTTNCGCDYKTSAV